MQLRVPHLCPTHAFTSPMQNEYTTLVSNSLHRSLWKKKEEKRRPSRLARWSNKKSIRTWGYVACNGDYKILKNTNEREVLNFTRRNAKVNAQLKQFLTVPLHLCRALVPFARNRKFWIDGKSAGLTSSLKYISRDRLSYQRSRNDFGNTPDLSCQWLFFAIATRECFILKTDPSCKTRVGLSATIWLKWIAGTVALDFEDYDRSNGSTRNDRQSS